MLLALARLERERVCGCVGLNAPRVNVYIVLQIYIQLHTVRTRSVACTDSICQRRQLRRISYPSRLALPIHKVPSLYSIDPRLGVSQWHAYPDEIGHLSIRRLSLHPRSKRPGKDETAASPANSPHLTTSRPRDVCQHLSIVTPRKFSCAGK